MDLLKFCTPILLLKFVVDLMPNLIKFYILGPDEEDDEPLLSGSGKIEKECSEEEVMGWSDILEKWKDQQTRPKQLIQLVRKVSIILYHRTNTMNIPVKKGVKKGEKKASTVWNGCSLDVSAMISANILFHDGHIQVSSKIYLTENYQ